MTTKDLRNNIEKVLGNSIRCLLPSYWWKRLFHQVADTIDEVNGVDIVSSESALNRLDAPIGSLASIANKKAMKPSECYVPTNEDSNLTDEEFVAKLTRLTGLEVSFPLPDITGVEATAVLVGEGAGGEGAWLGFLVISEGFCFAAFAESLTNEKTFFLTSQSSVNSLNTFLKQHKFYYVGLDFEPEDTEEYIKETTELYDRIFTIVDCTSDVYVRGMSWEKLAKKGDVGEYTGSSGLPIYVALGNALLTAEQIAANKNTLANIYKEIPYAVFEFDLAGEKVSFKYPIALYFASTTNTLFYITDWDNGTSDLLGFSLNSDGTVTRVNDKKSGGLETRSFKSTNSTTDKEWNKETISLFLEGKVNIVCPYPTPNGALPEGTSIDLMPNIHIYQNGTHQFWFTEQHPFGGHTNYLIAIQSDGTYDDDVEEFKPNTEMSDTSTNTVQNKVIKKYVDTEVAKKVDKVSGKGLSTEDFTTLLKTKLEGLENYDDTTLTNAISSLETRLNTLVSGDTSAAIESFNEVIAFLENLTDTQDLSSIIASIEQQINTKQDKINDLEDIRSGASLGKTSLQEHQDISHLATKEEVQNVVDDILENEEVYAAAVNDLNNRVTTTDTLLATETTNREVLQTEVQTINTNILENEEVIAATLVDLNSQIASLNVILADLTTRIETLENA